MGVDSYEISEEETGLDPVTFIKGQAENKNKKIDTRLRSNPSTAIPKLRIVSHLR